MTEIAIKVEGLSKRYRIGDLVTTRHRTLTAAIASVVGKPVKNLKRLRSLSSFSDDAATNVVWALRDASFEVNKGEVLGVIGRNGSGKSTLLKILSKITEPTSGQAELRGRVSSLLEVGTGFHPELTGRENTYLNGAILGMRRVEIGRKFDQIVDFSGVGRFIDTPVKHFSTGMKVRLAFAVAAHLEPEILLIDEVLAVGDAEFQQKCLGRMGEVAGSGRTVIFVSHNMGAVMSLCNRAIVLEQGKIDFDGHVPTAIDHYRERNSILASGRLDGPGKFGVKSKKLTLDEAIVTSGWSYDPKGYFAGGPIEFTIGLNATEPVERVTVAIRISSVFGDRIVTLHSSNNSGDDPFAAGGPGRLDFKCSLGQTYLAPGLYSVRIQVESDHGAFNADPAFLFEILHKDLGRRVSGSFKDGFLFLPSDWIMPGKG